MNNDAKFTICALLLIIAVLTALIVTDSKKHIEELKKTQVDALEHGYKNGQVSALSGTINYELIVNADKTSSWELIKKDKKQ